MAFLGLIATRKERENEAAADTLHQTLEEKTVNQAFAYSLEHPEAVGVLYKRYAKPLPRDKGSTKDNIQRNMQRRQQSLHLLIGMHAASDSLQTTNHDQAIAFGLENPSEFVFLTQENTPGNLSAKKRLAEAFGNRQSRRGDFGYWQEELSQQVAKGYAALGMVDRAALALNTVKEKGRDLHSIMEHADQMRRMKQEGSVAYIAAALQLTANEDDKMPWQFKPDHKANALIGLKDDALEGEVIDQILANPVAPTNENAALLVHYVSRIGKNNNRQDTEKSWITPAQQKALNALVNMESFKIMDEEAMFRLGRNGDREDIVGKFYDVVLQQIKVGDSPVMDSVMPNIGRLDYFLDGYNAYKENKLDRQKTTYADLVNGKDVSDTTRQRVMRLVFNNKIAPQLDIIGKDETPEFRENMQVVTDAAFGILNNYQYSGKMEETSLFVRELVLLENKDALTEGSKGREPSCVRTLFGQTTQDLDLQQPTMSGYGVTLLQKLTKEKRDQASAIAQEIDRQATAIITNAAKGLTTEFKPKI